MIIFTAAKMYHFHTFPLEKFSRNPSQANILLCYIFIHYCLTKQLAMKHTVLCLFSVCTLLMPTPPAVAQNEIFRQNEFPTLDSLLRHENYVDGARLAEGHRNRVAKALAQSPLKPDTLPEA